jgi:hypothetical protein
MAAFSSEERQAFFGAIGSDSNGAEHLFGLTSVETDTYLQYRRRYMDSAVAPVESMSEHIALYEKHRRACKAGD